MKTPEEYFQDTVKAPGAAGDMTPAEQAFLQKYLGLDAQRFLGGVREVSPSDAESLPGFAPAPAPAVAPKAPAPAPAAPAAPAAPTAPAERAPAPVQAAPAAPAAPVRAQATAPMAARAGRAAAQETDEIEALKREPELKLVGFLVGRQEFAVPITSIQEVIRYMEPTKLPAAPAFLSGIINLRGRVTPLVRLRKLLTIAGADEAQDKFIIVCRSGGLQVGLMVTAVVTMYRAQQEKIEWGVESRVGIQASLLAGLLKAEDRLINILSVDRLVSRVLGK